MRTFSKIGFFIFSSVISIFVFLLICYITGVRFNIGTENAIAAPTDYTPKKYEKTNVNSQKTSYVISKANEPQFCSDEQININVYENTHKSVVNINNRYIQWYFFEPQQIEGGGGSGSIIDKKGHILTNFHVIEDAVYHKDAELWVTLYDNSKLKAKIQGYDKYNDLAIIKIDCPASKLFPVQIYDGRFQLKVGQKILAIGNPFGLERTLTTGIISSLGRTINPEKNVVLENIIQSDAAINPGNSGGPLLNTAGELIGVNTAISSPNRGSVGIGFTISYDTINRIVPDLLKYGMVKRPVLGIIQGISLTDYPNLIEGLKLNTNNGVFIIDVEKDSAIDEAGLKPMKIMKEKYYYYAAEPGDIIVQINDRKINSLIDIFQEIKNKRIGDKVELSYIHDGNIKKLEITLKKGNAKY